MVHHVEFQSGPNTLRGMLHVPDGRRPFPAVLFCHGFTGSRVESGFLFVRIARRLEAAGIAALRFDFAGSGESDGEFDQMTTSGELADAGAALDFLRRHPAVDAPRVGAIGLSLGGVVAATLTVRRSEHIRALVLLAAAADPGRIVSFIRTGKHETHLATKGYMYFGGLAIRRPFLQDIVQFKPAEEIARWPGPLLIVQGGKDTSVPPSEAYEYRSQRDAAGTPTQFELIRDAEHTFDTVEHSARVIELVTGFFAEHLAGGAIESRKETGQ